MEIHPPIFIIGYMACGKTTLGRALARRLGREFIDLDFYIEQRFRRSISQIFATDGEEAFRSAEHAMLAEVGEMQDVVIACGGGTPCFHGNMDFMLSRGTVIYLDTSVDRIVERLTRNRSRRPLMAGKDPSQRSGSGHSPAAAVLHPCPCHAPWRAARRPQPDRRDCRGSAAAALTVQLLDSVSHCLCPRCRCSIGWPLLYVGA